MNWKLEIENWKLTRQGFTIVELLVAMSLLVILLGLSGMVFSTTVAAHRAAGATIDVSRNLRAITDQLNADFRGLQKDAPLTIWFEQQWVDTDGDTVQDIDEIVRFDQIQFFADGDFQTTKQYSGQTVHGNMARIYYGHAWQIDYSKPVPGFLKKGYRQFSTVNGDTIDREPSNILARRIHVSTNSAAMPPFPTIDPALNQLTAFLPNLNNYYEFDSPATLALWKQLLTNQPNCDLYLDTCFNNAYDLTDILSFMQTVGRPVVGMEDFTFLHNLLAQGVVQMQIQWAYTADDLVVPGLFTGVRWWPSVDPDGNGDVTDSDYITMTRDQFGVYFTMPGGTTNPNWTAVQGCGTNGVGFKNTFYPKALKFTIVLRDSNGVFAEGKTFTHIVYIDN